MGGKLANGMGNQYSHTTSECGVSSITNADAHNSAASSPADLNGLVRFVERRNLVSASVPSHFKRTLPSVLGFSMKPACYCSYRKLNVDVWSDVRFLDNKENVGYKHCIGGM